MRVSGAAALLVLFLAFAQPVAAQVMDVNQVISGIGGADFQDGVRQIDSTADVRVVRLSTLAGSSQAADRLHDALAARPREIAYLHSSIVLNPAALWALQNAGFEVQQVVSLTVAGDSAAILFVNDL